MSDTVHVQLDQYNNTYPAASRTDRFSSRNPTIIEVKTVDSFPLLGICS